MLDYRAYKTILVHKAEGVATLTLNRPERLNAIGGGLLEELTELFRLVNLDEDVRAILLTGAGRAFCAGGDLREAAEHEEPTVDAIPNVVATFPQKPRELFMAMLDVQSPIVVAMNGDAVGQGAVIALMGDIVIAASTARIGDTHVRAGLVPGCGGTTIWPLLVGINRAKEYLMTSELIAAPEAERLGLVNHVVPPEEVLPTAQGFARRLAEGPSWAIRRTKAALNVLIREQAERVMDLSLAFEGLSSMTRDHREGVQAFLQKRPARFEQPGRGGV